MKKLLLMAALCVSGLFVNAQDATVTNTTPSVVTNTPTIKDGVQQIVDAIKFGNTNWYFAVYGLYAPALNDKYGGGVGAFYPINRYLVTGVRVDYVNGGFWMPSGNATLQLPVKLTPWLTVTPFGYAGLGVPISGAKFGDITVPGSYTDNNGQPTAILGYGAAVDIYVNRNTAKRHWYQPDRIYLIADKETWSGFKGEQIRVGLMLNKSF